MPDLDLPDDYNPRQINPALLTFDEYRQLVDRDQKCHPSSAYDFTLEQMNQFHSDPADWPRLVRRLTRNGLVFEIRLRLDPLDRVVQRDADGSLLRIDGELQYYSLDQLRRLGWPTHEWRLAVFEGGQRVAFVEDEWGCVLVAVAREYRGFGLGPLLVKLARSIEPGKPSGGFTPGGFRTFHQVYREFVGDALRSGLYRQLVRQGTISMARVKAIVASAGARPTPSATPALHLGSADPANWLLYVGEYGDFIIYDKALRDALTGGDRVDYFRERMLKGLAYVQIHDGRGGQADWAMTRAFGAATPALARLLMNCAITYCVEHQATLFVEPEEYAAVDPALAQLGPESLVRGFRARQVMPSGRRFDYRPLGRAEAAWRRTFDRYDEFRLAMLELAYAKFR